MTSRVSWLGVEAPAVTATRFFPFSHSVFSWDRSSTRTAGTPASSSDTCTRRFVLLLRGSPTTTVRSSPFACATTASWLLCVVAHMSMCTSAWSYCALIYYMTPHLSHL